MSLILVYVTHGSQQAARELADAMVRRRLAACANLLPIESAYWWEGEIQHDSEWVSLLKTLESKWDELREAIEAQHPYDVPCVLKLSFQANPAYARWIADQVS